MAKISKTEVKKMAKLARLKLKRKEVEDATKDLSNILRHFSKIQTLDTRGIPTSDDVTGTQNITRKDEPDQGDLAPAQSLIKAAPETKDGQVKVKAVFN